MIGSRLRSAANSVFGSQKILGLGAVESLTCKEAGTAPLHRPAVRPNEEHHPLIEIIGLFASPRRCYAANWATPARYSRTCTHSNPPHQAPTPALRRRFVVNSAAGFLHLRAYWGPHIAVTPCDRGRRGNWPVMGDECPAALSLDSAGAECWLSRSSRQITMRSGFFEKRVHVHTSLASAAAVDS
jgi:hypothetical protein